MKYFARNNEKSESLKRQPGVSFEDIVFHIQREDLLDVLEHLNQQRYPGQRIFILNMDDYVLLVPFVESSTEIFLKTIILSRKATNTHIRRRDEDG